MMRLSYTVLLQQTDNQGHPNGDVFSFSGSQTIADYPPTGSDLTGAATAMGVDIGNQMISGTGYAQQAAQNNAGD